MLRIAFALILHSFLSAAQSPYSYVPLTGEQFEYLLSKAFISQGDLAFQTKFAISVRILPPFGVESQLTLVCDLKSKCFLGRTVLTRPLRQVADDALARGISVSEVLNLPVRFRRETVPLANQEAQVAVSELWRAIRASAELAEKDSVALAAANSQIKIALDPTSYVVSLSQFSTSVDVNIAGPDPERARIEAEVDPLVRWSLGLSELLEAQLQKSLAEKGQ